MCSKMGKGALHVLDTEGTFWKLKWRWLDCRGGRADQEPLAMYP